MTPKEIETYLLLHEQKVESFVKQRSKAWLIAAGVFLVLLTVLLFTVFRKTTKTSDSYELKVNALDSVVKYQQKNIETLEKYNEGQDSVIAHLNEAYKNNRPTETRIIHEYERIPIDVNSLNRDELRKQVTNY